VYLHRREKTDTHSIGCIHRRLIIQIKMWSPDSETRAPLGEEKTAGETAGV
jgi:hypothetical protein